MARFRSANLRPVNSIKHIVDQSATLTAGTNLEVIIAIAKEEPLLANTAEVTVGSRINSFFVNIQVASNETDAGAIPNVYVAFYKNPEGLVATVNPGAMGVNPRKKWIFHQEMIMFNNVAGGNPRTLFKGVLMIPKKMRRMGFDDEILMVVRSNAVNIALCIQTIYKEFR